MEQLSLIEDLNDKCFQYYYLVYSGYNKYLAENTIDVQHYATSISGYSNFVKYVANEILESNVDILLVVFEDGSFRTKLKVAWTTIELTGVLCSILGFFNIDHHDIENLFFNLQNVIIEEIKSSKNGVDDIIININDDGSMSINEKNHFTRIFNSNDFRKSLNDFTAPLSFDGYESILVEVDSLKTYQIDHDDRGLFEYIPPAEEIVEPFHDVVEVVYLSPGKNKWQFKGKEEFWAEVLDENFINRTKNKKASDLKGQFFRVAGRKTTTRKLGAKRRSTVWEIDSISEFEQQIKLPLA